MKWRFNLLLLCVSLSSSLEIKTSAVTTSKSLQDNNTGILITGGATNVDVGLLESEVYHVSTGEHCTLPPLPAQIAGHTQVESYMTYYDISLHLCYLNNRITLQSVEARMLSQHVCNMLMENGSSVIIYCRHMSFTQAGPQLVEIFSWWTDAARN